jgi:hypothetical protein
VAPSEGEVWYAGEGNGNTHFLFSQAGPGPVSSGHRWTGTLYGAPIAVRCSSLGSLRRERDCWGGWVVVEEAIEGGDEGGGNS